ncbi:MAG: hypothetical protein AABW67_03755 [Nanoarchaeota archaeon]
MRKKEIVIYSVLVILIIIIIGVIFIIKPNPNLESKKDLALCLAEKSELYVQLGCKFCKVQEDMFGEDYIYLNMVDCAYESDKCARAEISGTPTWIINGQKYAGVQQLDTLKILTGC